MAGPGEAHSPTSLPLSRLYVQGVRGAIACAAADALHSSFFHRRLEMAQEMIPFGKRLLDVALSGAGLIASTPLWIGIAAAIKMEDGGAVFYTQDRVGEGGRHFTVFKFRSMIPDAEAGVGAVQSGEDDP